MNFPQVRKQNESLFEEQEEAFGKPKDTFLFLPPTPKNKMKCGKQGAEYPIPPLCFYSRWHPLPRQNHLPKQPESQFVFGDGVAEQDCFATVSVMAQKHIIIFFPASPLPM